MEKAVYRIIDANLNRAREAARMAEEYCRFVLDNESLTARAKRLRHQLCGAAAGLDPGKLMAARDSVGDVGRGMQVDGQMARRQLRDVALAACKRLTEALRALAETAAVIDPQAAGAFERLRFDAYSLEKDILLADDAQARFGRVRLYVLITVKPDDSDNRIMEIAAQCAQGGTDCLQLRAKNLPDDRTLQLAKALVKTCAEYNIISIINDRADIAAAAGADGVHLGQNDISLHDARRIMPKPALLGISTHNLQQLHAALQQNPAYIALGPAFPTKTKQAPAVGREYILTALEQLRGKGVGHVAIGGISLQNVDEVLGLGVKTVAVCAAVTESDDPRQACQLFKERLNGR